MILQLSTIEKPTELSTEKKLKQADLVYHCQEENPKDPTNPYEYLLHMEVQTLNDANMPIRMNQYALLIYEKHKMPLRQVCLFLGNKENPKCTMQDRLDFIEPVEHSYRYNLIDISTIPYQLFLENPETALFSILGDYQEKSKEEVLEEIIAKRLPKGNKETLGKFYEDFVIIAELRKLFDKKLFEKIKDMIDITLEDTFLYKEGEEKGIAKGKLEGIEKGKREKEISMILKMFENKIDIDTIKSVSGLNTDELLDIKNANK